MKKKSKCIEYKMLSLITCMSLSLVLYTGCTSDDTKIQQSVNTATSSAGVSTEQSVSKQALSTAEQPSPTSVSAVPVSTIIGYLQQADKLLSKSNQYDQALHLYDKVIELDPNCVRAYLGKGKIFSRKGEYDQALQLYDKAIELDPNCARAYLGKGKVFSRKGEVDKEINAYDKAIEIEPDNAEAYYYKGGLFYSRGEDVKAKQAFDMAIACDPGFEGPIMTLFDRAIDADPKNTSAYIEKSRSLEALGKYKYSIMILDCAFESVPKKDFAKVHYEKALVYAANYLFEDAISSLKQCVELDSKYVKKAAGEAKFSALKDIEGFKTIIDKI